MAEKGKRGFAAMDREKQRQIASMGGKAAHRKGTAHEFTPEEARAAGQKGGRAAHEKGRAHVFTADEARAAGRKGGQSARALRVGPEEQTVERQPMLPSDPENPNGDLGHLPEPSAENDERRELSAEQSGEETFRMVPSR